MPDDKKGGLALILGLDKKKDRSDDNDRGNGGDLEEAKKAAFDDFRTAMKDEDSKLGISALSALIDMIALSDASTDDDDDGDEDEQDN